MFDARTGNVSKEFIEERIRNSPFHLLKRQTCARPFQNQLVEKEQEEKDGTNRETD